MWQENESGKPGEYPLNLPFNQQRRQRNPSRVAIIPLNLTDIRLLPRKHTVQRGIEHRGVLAESITLQIHQPLDPSCSIFRSNILSDDAIDLFQFSLELAPLLKENPLRMLQKQNEDSSDQRSERKFFPIGSIQKNVILFVDEKSNRSSVHLTMQHLQAALSLLNQSQKFVSLHSFKHTGIIRPGLFP